MPFVDDGVSSYEEALKIIKLMIEDGIEEIVCTPHFQSGATRATKEIQEENFYKLKELVQKEALAVKLFLGYEVRFRDYLNPDYQKLTINGSKYLLLEFSFYTYLDIYPIIEELTEAGFKIIIAHIERYSYLNFEDYYRLVEMGVLLQVNSKPIVYPESEARIKQIRRLFKEKLVSFVASDVHNLTSRPNYLKEAYEILKKELPKDYLEAVFYNNAKKILTS
ncbi:MAG: hypothetical protein M0P92_03885 [Acholeplasmataceae bacterium]|nr:hypothetical protein [Acholeplasmataceae bacterium]MCK9234403.1 hypothetical protein [Acholeplasmataceae bacterium]MCK9289346.1 hypothetical protein [Acholeplasmataceae bacterium]MCK9427809.1 hypothetical protein [Acholeplasmataceae bacterium]